jgi:flagellar biosynthesis protein FlhB
VAEQDFQERNEKATSRRLEKAREEGQVAKSADLNAAVLILVACTAFYFIGPHTATQTGELIRYFMTNAAHIAMGETNFVATMADAAMRCLLLLAPICTALFVGAFAISVAQVGFVVSPKALAPKFERLDLVSGFKRLFAQRSLVHLAKDFIKLFAIGAVAYYSIKADFPSFATLSDMAVPSLAKVMGASSLLLAFKLGLTYLALAILDYFYQRFDFEKSMRMSRQELREEYKETEGSPQLKARVRQMQKEMARQRMMAAVPTANVVVTNPTHLAVALKYDTLDQNAPIVVAKGERLIAQRIKEIAREHGVPVIEDKPLARTLYKICEVGQIIPANLYRAVAELLAYVYRLKGKKVN